MNGDYKTTNAAWEIVTTRTVVCPRVVVSQGDCKEAWNSGVSTCVGKTFSKCSHRSFLL